MEEDIMEMMVVVPSPEGCVPEDQEEDTPLFHDQFLGVTLDPVLKPLDVVFVESNSENSGHSEFLYNSDHSLVGRGFSLSEFRDQQEQSTDCHGNNNNNNTNFCYNSTDDYGAFDGSNWFENEEQGTLLESLLTESEVAGYSNEFINLVDSAESSAEEAEGNENCSTLKTPVDILKEIQREAEEIETAAAVRQSVSPCAYSDSAHTSTTASPMSVSDFSDDSAEVVPPILSIPLDQLPEKYRHQAEYVIHVTADGAILNVESPRGGASNREDHSFCRKVKKGRCKKGNLVKKERKKEQNREAASRYRVKRRDEKEKLKTELSELEEINRSLRKVVEDKQQQIRYIKDFLREVRENSKKR